MDRSKEPPKADQDFRVVVIGASAGGVQALQQVVSQFPADLNAAIFCVLHLSPGAPSMLPNILARSTELPVHPAVDGEKLERGVIYCAVPDFHLTLEPERICLNRGPRENRQRPSIDTLFRTAARSFGPRAIGVLLTGLLDDGVDGLIAIKRHGGIVVVQDPEEALFNSMPAAAVQRANVDYILRLAEIPHFIAKTAAKNLFQAPELKAKDPMRDIRHDGKPFQVSCPDCGGALWVGKDGDTETFECRIGHKYSLPALLAAHSDAVERAMCEALRALEESAALSERMARHAQERGFERAASRYHSLAQGKQQHINVLNDLLGNNVPLPVTGVEEHEPLDPIAGESSRMTG